jgi:hypothetical protein
MGPGTITGRYAGTLGFVIAGLQYDLRGNDLVEQDLLLVVDVVDEAVESPCVAEITRGMMSKGQARSMFLPSL